MVDQTQESEPFIELEKCEKESDYIYDKDGVLKNKQDGSSFKFTKQDDYEKVAKYVTAYVQSSITDTHKMNQIWVPGPAKILRDFNNNFKGSTHPQADIYVSPDFLTNDKLLCLIQGTGRVKAGIWSRAVCINDSVNLGSVIPFLELAKKYGLAVVIFNPNERKDPRTGKDIPQFTTMEKHCLYVWENVIEKFSKAKEIYIVAHSMGGYCTVDMMRDFSSTFQQRVKKIAFTDSVHGTRPRILDKKTYNHLKNIAINFVTSKEPKGTYLESYDKSGDGVNHCSAGHDKHEYTTGCAFTEIEKFFFDDNYLSDMIKEASKKKKFNGKDDNLSDI